MAKKIIPLAALLIIMLASCDLLLDLNKKVDSFDILEQNSFYAQNMITRKYYKVKAEQLWEGRTCIIWAEKGSGVKQSQAKEIADKYDTIIRPQVVDIFSKEPFSVNNNGTSYFFNDMLVGISLTFSLYFDAYFVKYGLPVIT